MDWQKNSDDYKSKKEKINLEKNRITGDANKLKHEIDSEDRRGSMIRSTGIKKIIDDYEKSRIEFDATVKSQREKLEKEWDDILDIEDELDKKFNSKFEDPDYKRFKKEQDEQYQIDRKRKEAIVQAEGDKYYKDLLEKQNKLKVNETYFYKSKEDICLFHVLDSTIEKTRYGFGSMSGDKSLASIHTVHDVSINKYTAIVIQSNINKWLIKNIDVNFDEQLGKFLNKAAGVLPLEENEKMGSGIRYSQSFLKILFEDSIKFY